MKPGRLSLARGPVARYPCRRADVAKLVDARDLKSLGPKGCAGSIPAVRTKNAFKCLIRKKLLCSNGFCSPERYKKAIPRMSLTRAGNGDWFARKAVPQVLRKSSDAASGLPGGALQKVRRSFNGSVRAGVAGLGRGDHPPH